MFHQESSDVHPWKKFKQLLSNKTRLYEALKIFNKESNNEQINSFIQLIDEVVVEKITFQFQTFWTTC